MCVCVRERERERERDAGERGERRLIKSKKGTTVVRRIKFG